MDIFKTRCSIRRRVALYMVGGLGVTVVLTLLSAIFSWTAPYRDLPMMPKPFFVLALAPGILVGEAIEASYWIRVGAYLAANSVVYGAGLFFLDSLRIAIRDNRQEMTSQKSNLD